MRSEEHYPQMPQSPYTNSSFYEDGLNHGLTRTCFSQKKPPKQH